MFSFSSASAGKFVPRARSFSPGPHLEINLEITWRLRPLLWSRKKSLNYTMHYYTCSFGLDDKRINTHSI